MAMKMYMIGIQNAATKTRCK